MHRRLKILLALVLAAAAARPARAAFEDLGAGARAPGMGDAFTAVADDVYAVYYNPAGLGLLTRPQFGASYTRLHWGLSDGSRLGTSFMGYAHPLEGGQRGTLAAAWNSFTLDSSLYREDALYMSYGRLMLADPDLGDLYLGASLKYLRSSFGSFQEASQSTNGVIVQPSKPDPLLTGSKSQGDLDADLGALYRFTKHYSVGLQMTHLFMPDMAYGSSDSDRLPIGVKLGANYRSLISNLVAQVETQSGPGGGRDMNFTLGAERWFPRLFTGDMGMRGAFSIGSRDYKQLSLGFSYRTRRLQVDYGFALPVGTVSSTAGSHRLGMTIRFGRATDDEETLEMLLEAMQQIKERAREERSEQVKDLTASQRVAFDEYMNQCYYLMRRGRYQEGMEQFSRALTIVPADGKLLLRYSRLNLVVQYYPSLDRYLSDPVESELHQGARAFVDGRDLEAIDKVSTALSLRPSDKKLDMFLTQLEMSTGLKRLTDLKHRPKSLILKAKLTRAEAALEAKKWREAIELSLSVLREDDKIARAWENLGTAYFALKDFDSSVKAWQKGYQHEKSPAVRQAILNYIRSIERLRKRYRRTKRVRAIPKPKISDQERRELYNQGVDHFIRREHKKAEEAFRKILDARPNDTEARRALERVRQELRGQAVVHPLRGHP